jgi:hypothetical protein
MKNDNRQETIKGFPDRLRDVPWTWFGTLNITSRYPSEYSAKKMFAEWIEGLRRSEGNEKFGWFRVLGKNADGNNLYFRTLITGLSPRREVWEKRWAELGGDALIRRFDDEQDGIAYIQESIGDDGDDNCDFQLPKNLSSTADFVKDKTAPATLHVDGMDSSTTLLELKKLFMPYRLLEIAFVGNWTDINDPTISATVTVKDYASAASAVGFLDKKIELGREKIRVSLVE